MNQPKHPFKHGGVTERAIKVFYDVYNELGHGFLESVYREALLFALREAGLRVEKEVCIPVWFRGRKVGDFRADLVVEEKIILELKAARALTSADEAQVMNYLRATEIEVGLLLNFGPSPVFRRIAYVNDRKQIRVFLRESAAESQ